MKNCLVLFYINTNFLSKIKNPTRYKILNNLSCQDHILTNNPKSFFKAETIYPGLSDFHEMVSSVFKLHFLKTKDNEILYTNFKHLKEGTFNRGLQKRLSAESVEKYSSFQKKFLGVLNKHPPLKKKVVRPNQAPYVTKTLRKTIMKRSYSEKVHFKKRTSRFINKF